MGFRINLREKVLIITQKHQQKITEFFDRFLRAARRKGSIPIRDIQKMLGLQISISTVFRVARQFLTSICDILRGAGQKRFFHPRKQPQLVRRFIFDLKF